jgi:pyruvate dehydrogenase E1 component
MHPRTEAPDYLTMKARENTKNNKWLESTEAVLELLLKDKQPEQTSAILAKMLERLRSEHISVPTNVTTPYVNTIPPEKEEEYPGDWRVERRIKSYIRWNAMAMVVNANRKHKGLGGHISTFASSATLYEVAYNHFFRGDDDGKPADIIYFQGHATPGNYARAYLERRLDERHLHNFRQELAEGGGLSSYPHPYLMPDYWQFPTVSMGLGPMMSIYQARFNRYLAARKLVSWEREPKVWAFVGDGECDEPETLGQLALAARENLDNLIWVINCNLQRLDGPVRGNSKIIQELEGIFRGAGWNVLKVIWGKDWDDILARDTDGALRKRMMDTVDGQYQKYSISPGSYIRKDFFGGTPDLRHLVHHLSDDQLTKLLRGGHDTVKVYTAYKTAMAHKGQPTVILAKTIKGYGLGEAGEGRNITHGQKAMNEKELREFRARFDIPISDEEIAQTPFCRPAPDSPESKYLMARRKALGGAIPKRVVRAKPLKAPTTGEFAEFLKGSASEASTTMVFVNFLRKLIRHKEVGRNVVPIIPDEARTFGMDGMFSEVGIYSPKGQLYEPVDKGSLLYYNETKDGQILEEGINEAGSMASFTAAATAYATHGVNMIPFYIYYSMFGFQRVGDQIWLCGDIRARGFLLGGTAGRTTLNGEGLQHQDGHGHLIASALPNLVAYDPAFAFEIAVIICDGIKRMYQDGEDIFYYLTLQNENYAMPAMPEGAEEGILKGLYKFKPGATGKRHKAHIFGSGSIIRSALKAQEILAEKYNVSADVWSATSYKQLRTDTLNCKRWNMLHPTETPRKSYLETTLAKEDGTFVAVSDNMKIVADQIAPWVPGGLMTLGTDGFGRSDTREKLRRFFEVDAECTVIGTLYALCQKGEIDCQVVNQAIKDLGVDPEKVFPILV